jgi:hypothetical protein
MADIVYDATVSFLRRFYEKHDRTVDQMLQAGLFMEAEYHRSKNGFRDIKTQLKLIDASA